MGDLVKYFHEGQYTELARHDHPLVPFDESELTDIQAADVEASLPIWVPPP